MNISKAIARIKDAVINIIEWLNTIAKDKYQHFALGVLIASAVMIVTMPFSAWWQWLPMLASMISVMTAAIIKERRVDPKADLYDILWTLAGGGRGVGDIHRIYFVLTWRGLKNYQ